MEKRYQKKDTPTIETCQDMSQARFLLLLLPVISLVAVGRIEVVVDV